MNKLNLSPRIVEYLFGILATAFIVVGTFLYILQEPARIVSAQDEQLQTDLLEAMTLYAENCSLCHGLAGEGIGSNPALNTSSLNQSDRDALYKVISRGLYGTSMPAWNITDGGPLSDYQVNELVTLIQYGDWEETKDIGVNLGIAPLIPFTAEPDPTILDGLNDVENGQILAEGITVYARDCVACHGADGLGTALAPPLNDPVVMETVTEEIERVILKGVPGTLMAPWENSLTDDEVVGLIELIQNWDKIPDGAIPSPEISIPVTEESLILGSDLYAANCASCHGPEGQGKPKAPALNVKGFLEDTNDAAIQQIITMGVPDTSMPAWGDRMTEAEIQALVGFIRSWEPTAPEVAEPARGGGGPWWRSGDAQSSPGKGRGGPPWMTDSNQGNQQNQQNLPSGGSTGNGQQGSANKGKSMQEADNQLGESPNAQKLNQLDQMIDKETTESQPLSHNPPSGHGQSWESQQEAQTSWWDMNWRPVLLIAGSFVPAFLLVILAVSKLRRLPSEVEK